MLHMLNFYSTLHQSSYLILSEPLKLQGDCLSSASSKAKDKVVGRLLLNVAVRKGMVVLKLFSGENETFLVGRNFLLILNLLALTWP